MTTDHLTTSRPRKARRPIPIGEPCVRHDVLEVDALGTSRRLHSGVALQDETSLLFARACREAGQAPAGQAPTVVLERVTVETLAVREPGGRIFMAKATLPPGSEATVEPSPRRNTIADFATACARFFAAAVETLGEEAGARERRARQLKATARNPLSGSTCDAATFVTIVAPTETGPLVTVQSGQALVALFKIGASHQGGHSGNGKAIADALEVPFPLTMPELAHRALEIGLKPSSLWPWWASAPRTLDDARRMIARANAPECALCEGGCGRLRVEPCACPTTEPTA